eukprot:CAMPEP_0170173406 /NCGR_PEP_ID=MMETSP0040_2-20121228/6695_1 /TAXON_ID=641309 /ORGANISM="Lotharella oceanica, Strain CCMP622" /LENGTH=31 /DNA_ID= /DNA_START= /DNA_END= /DNA_ORIENTATION=
MEDVGFEIIGMAPAPLASFFFFALGTLPTRP